jgi:hypothetical protein
MKISHIKIKIQLSIKNSLYFKLAALWNVHHPIYEAKELHMLWIIGHFYVCDYELLYVFIQNMYLQHIQKCLLVLM